jgi:ribose/xylose/arabinose/galactoside ABC-type transport system permease subunit
MSIPSVDDGTGQSSPGSARAMRRPRFSWFTRYSWLGPFIALVVLYAVFATIEPDTFSSLATFRTMVRQTTMVGVAALGMTMVIILGGIDLSVGSIVALTTIVIAQLLSAGYSPLAAALGGIAAAACCGLVNGALITSLRVTPFIVTLGAMGVIRGAAKGLAHEQKVDAPVSWLNELLAELSKGSTWQLFPPGVWMMLALAVVAGLALRYTRFGRHVFAIGSNEQAARVCGIAITRVKVAVYTLAAALAGVAGVMQFSRLTVGDPTVAAGLELDVIAAVVIGGGSMSGGEGSIAGALVGAMLMTEIKTGCAHMGLSIWVQEIITGLIIVAAVALDRLRHRRGAA